MRSNTSSDPTRGKFQRSTVLTTKTNFLLNDIPASAFKSVEIFDQANVMKDFLVQISNAVTATSQETQKNTTAGKLVSLNNPATACFEVCNDEAKFLKV